MSKKKYASIKLAKEHGMRINVKMKDLIIFGKAFEEAFGITYRQIDDHTIEMPGICQIYLSEEGIPKLGIKEDCGWEWKNFLNFYLIEFGRKGLDTGIWYSVCKECNQKIFMNDKHKCDAKDKKEWKLVRDEADKIRTKLADYLQKVVKK